MIADKRIFILLMFLIIFFGCTTGASSTKSDTDLQSKGKINCATIETMTEEERLFCHGGNR